MDCRDKRTDLFGEMMRVGVMRWGDGGVDGGMGAWTGNRTEIRRGIDANERRGGEGGVWDEM